MSQLPRIGIVLGSTREGRFADRPAEWLMNLAKARTDATFELVDLRDYPMPFFDEPRSPMIVPPKNEVALRWGRKVAELDAFIFVTPEYNHSISAVLKNALDYAYNEFNRKPATFVAYGNTGGARAVEQLRLILAELQVASLKHAVHIGYTEFFGMLMHGKTFADFPHLEQSAARMFDDLMWWTRTLRAGRAA
ncbi:putative reductase [Labilithrix luteola]|uniref:Putative reductase n=1 Tax=Labilithrix luteola TaxID=1391654 RepID=A0A0K1PPR1_9BACT|nr:NAD(P)H-dependent oxidoreductase [Labilithrix luteola]AKU95507.1 putative reductase [Labilithrix luteola]